MMDVLPFEVGVHVLTYCHAPDIAQIAGLSKSWHGLSLDPTLWRQLYMGRFPYAPLLRYPAYSDAIINTWRDEFKRATAVHNNWQTGKCRKQVFTGPGGHALSLSAPSLTFSKNREEDPRMAIASFDARSVTLARFEWADDCENRVGDGSVVEGAAKMEKLSFLKSMPCTSRVSSVGLRGDTVVGGNTDGGLYCWNANTGEETANYSRGFSWTECIYVDAHPTSPEPTACRIYAGYEDGTLYVFDHDESESDASATEQSPSTPSGDVEGRGQYVAGHSKNVMSIHPVDDVVATGSLDRNAKLWDLRTLTEKVSISAPRIIKSVLFDPPYRLFVACGNGNVYAYDIRTKDTLQTIEAHSTMCICMAFDKNTNTLVTGGADNKVKAFDVVTARVKYSDQLPSTVRAVEMDYSTITAASGANIVRYRFDASV